MRYALIGTGNRAQMYLKAIVGPHATDAELVAWADPNPGRMRWSGRVFTDAGRPVPRAFPLDELARVIRDQRIDRVIVTSPDFTHAEHIVTALYAGAEVIVEKPLTTTEEGVRRIAEAVERTGGRVTVTFNYRYSPRNAALKRVIAAGQIGEVTSVHFEWVLDTAHGADYFRRWHREKRYSGGLLIHKSSHHFDLVNWWLADTPARVFASGGLRFYGAAAAARRGITKRPERGTTDSPLRDAFSLDLRADPKLRGLYLEQEHHDGYLRDRDVFDAGITIEDNLSLVVDYRGGASMAYSLNAHSPWEGYTVAVNGTAGRAELSVVERGAVLLDARGRVTTDPSAAPEAVRHEHTRPVGERLVVQRHFEPAREVEIPRGTGGHGGGDAQLLADIFRAGAPGGSDSGAGAAVGSGAGSGAVDELGRAASWRDGAWSVAVGLAGNRSLSTGRAVAVSDLELGPALAMMSTVDIGADTTVDSGVDAGADAG